MSTYEAKGCMKKHLVNASPRMGENKIIKIQRFLIKFPVRICVKIILDTGEGVSQWPEVVWL